MNHWIQTWRCWWQGRHEWERFFWPDWCGEPGQMIPIPTPELMHYDPIRLRTIYLTLYCRRCLYVPPTSFGPQMQIYPWPAAANIHPFPR